MPSKHIDDATWRLVEKRAVDAVIKLKINVKETTMLKWLILKGLDEMTDEDYKDFIKKEKKNT